MKRRSARGGRGSNQYMRRPGGTLVDRPPVPRWLTTAERSDAGVDVPVPVEPVGLAAKVAGPDRLTDQEWEAVADTDQTLTARDAAVRPDCPGWVLTRFVKDHPDAKVRRDAARNPNCPPEVVAAALRDDPDVEVACYAARNPICPPEVIRGVIAADVDSERRTKVMHAAAQNREMPEDVHESLAASGFGYIYASRNWSSARVLTVAAQTSKTAVLSNIALHPNVDQGLLEELAQHRSADVRAAAAKNPVCSPQLLSRLAGSRFGEVVDAVAANPSTPTEVLESLWYAADRDRQKVIEANPSCPKHLTAVGGFLS